MKMENTVNNNFEEIFYDDFIRFVNDGLLNKLDKSVFTFLKDCGYIDTINLQGFRYLSKSGECELIDQSWSDFVAVIIEKIDGAENGSAAGSEIISSADSKAQMLKFDFDGRDCIVIPVYRIDEDAVYAKKLSLADKNIFLDKSNHYKAGYLYFIIESGSASAGLAGSNYSGFITVFLKSVIEIFDSLLTVRSQLDYKTRESNDYQLLLNVSGSIISTLNLNEVLQGIVDGATESLNSARGS
ncbi:MAG: hypothetical protein ACD_47C00181G0001, partial [uncultured bacterium]